MKKLVKIVAVSTIALGFGLTAYAEQKNSLNEYEITNTTQFTCSQETLTVDFLNKKQNNIALVTLSGDTVPTLLANVMAASGEKYVGSIYELWINGDSAMFTNLMIAPENAVECQIVPAQ
mgnify:FL=1